MSLDGMWQAYGHTLTNILPRSPFADFIAQAQEMPYLGWLNWVLPVADMLRVFGAWLGCVAIFYMVQIVLRWLKVIQG